MTFAPLAACLFAVPAFLHAGSAAPTHNGPPGTHAESSERTRSIWGPFTTRGPFTTLIARGSSWRFLDDGSNQGTAWRARGFDDSSWAQGSSQLGYGDGDERTVVSYGPDPDDKHLTTYFRHGFQVADPAAFKTLQLGLLRDDGAIVYLNGTEVARSNMPSGPVQYRTRASEPANRSDEAKFFHFGIDASLLVAGTNSIAVELHQVGNRNNDLSFDLELYGSQGRANLVRGPYLQRGTPDGCVIHWRTDRPTKSTLWGGTTSGSLRPLLFDGALKTEHVLSITGLSADTKYYYAIGDDEGMFVGDHESRYFVTAPRRGVSKPTRVWVIGDSGRADANSAAVRDGYVAATGAKHTDVWLMLGDNAYSSGDEGEYQNAVFDMYPGILRNTFLWPTFGNHDAGAADGLTQTGTYFEIFDLPSAGEAGGVPSGTEAYYSFDHGDIHFICLDSQDSGRGSGGPMLTWLRADLAATNATWIVAYWHHPPYSRGTHNSDDDGDSGGRMGHMRQRALPILEDGGVDLVLSGHSHAYERSYLLDGHYGKSATLSPSMILDSGDGEPDSDGAYLKTRPLGSPHAGTVYVVAGNSGAVQGGALNHPAMQYSISQLGSLVLEIDGDTLEATMIDVAGLPLDSFTIEKDSSVTLTRDEPRISLTSGGTQNLFLDAGPSFAGERYLVAGSFEMTPGFSYGGLSVPLNQDSWFFFSVQNANSNVYQQSAGVLDASGRAQATLQLPPAPFGGTIGTRLYHAFVIPSNGGLALDLVSNPVWLTVDP